MPASKNFICATREFNSFDAPVPAYYFRRSFLSEGKGSAKLTVAVCGLYELYFNGAHITRGFLSPYFSNPDDIVYYDEYEVELNEGENVVALILGNGFQNNPGGYIWDFDKADFRSAPKASVLLTAKTSGGERVLLESDESFKVCPSPIRSDDYRFGETYDANYEISGWNRAGFDDSAWENALKADAPKGELRVADIAPIVKEGELRPVEIIPSGDGFIYDFGVSHAGVCRLNIRGRKGQQIDLRHGDLMADGDIRLDNVWFVREFWERDRHIVHKDTYICKGEGTEEYSPRFTYHGFRYVRVDGIDKEQATPELLTYLVYHTQLHSRGDFECSDPISTKLQELTRRSILSNFHHFPTDCPQREKNGWTADAALSCEAALLNFDPERNYREWMRNICKAQSDVGSLPGIVPTSGWGFHWGNGPAWDCVLAYLPYFTYIYRGETDMIKESASAFLSYLRYLRTRVDENGLLAIGLGDWCHVGGTKPKAPLILTDSIMAMDIASKMAHMFAAVGMKNEETFALGEAQAYREAIRAHLVDDSLCVVGRCQSSQAMCLFYGVFEDAEKDAAFRHLLTMIHDADDHMDVGVLGGRVIFHVLSEFGHGDLAYKMICREDFPSYGNWLKRGATTLWESFLPNKIQSANHHFWGDISTWFIKSVCGINLNPTGHNVNEVEIKPHFIDALDRASAYHVAPAGKIALSWSRSEAGIELTVEIPEGVCATATLCDGYRFEDGSSSKALTSGIYKVIK